MLESQASHETTKMHTFHFFQYTIFLVFLLDMHKPYNQCFIFASSTLAVLRSRLKCGYEKCIQFVIKQIIDINL